jgi:hypothetical protein
MIRGNVKHMYNNQLQITVKRIRRREIPVVGSTLRAGAEAHLRLADIGRANIRIHAAPGDNPTEPNI